MRLWDISESVGPDTATFPGDTPFSREWIARIDRGDSCNVGTIRTSVHVGTHADAPLHFDDAGADIASVDLEAYVGPCRVIDVAGDGEPPLVPTPALGGDALRGAERVLLRTRSSHDHTRFDGSFTALGEAAAMVLVEAGVRLVGIDTPSVDHADSKTLDAHRALLRGGVAILENLDLSRVPAGDYELIALPLRLVGQDGSPVRAVLRGPLPGGIA
ncbi:MAG: kynurenine formamidase KynB [Planctomycetota bacterium]